MYNIYDIDLQLFAGEDVARVRIVNHHTNIVHISHNDQILLEKPVEESSEDRWRDGDKQGLKWPATF